MLRLPRGVTACMRPQPCRSARGGTLAAVCAELRRRLRAEFQLLTIDSKWRLGTGKGPAKDFGKGKKEVYSRCANRQALSDSVLWHACVCV